MSGSFARFQADTDAQQDILSSNDRSHPHEANQMTIEYVGGGRHTSRKRRLVGCPLTLVRRAQLKITGSRPGEEE